MSGGNLDHAHLVQALACSRSVRLAARSPRRTPSPCRRRCAPAPMLSGAAFAVPSHRRYLSLAGAPMIVPDGYVEVQRLLESGAPLVFVSGNAGTGKTTLIRYLRENLDLRSVVLAPTGVAALNAGGATIHSFFRFPPRIQDPARHPCAGRRRLYQRLELMIIDEVSMLRADVLDSIDAFLRECQGCPRAVRRRATPAAGRHVPTPSRGLARGARRVRRPRLREPLLLQRVSRSRTCPRARGARPGLPADRPGVRLAAQPPAGRRRTVERRWRRSTAVAAGRARDHEITLTCTNRVADDLNAAAMAALDTEERSLRRVGGQVQARRRPAASPLELRLKVGARVMFTKNDESGRWVNGTLGVVTWSSAAPRRGGLTDGSVHDVERVTWQTFEYRLDREADRIVADEVGHYTQYPADAGLGGHHPQEPGQDAGQRAGRLRLGSVRPRAGLCGAEPVPVAGEHPAGPAAARRRT